MARTVGDSAWTDHLADFYRSKYVEDDAEDEYEEPDPEYDTLSELEGR